MPKGRKKIVDPYASPFDYKERRSDGWPLCPFCGQDELWSFDQTEIHIIGCLLCSWFPKINLEEKKQVLFKMIGITNLEQQFNHLAARGLSK